MERTKRAGVALAVGAAAVLMGAGCTASRLAVPRMAEPPVEHAVERDTGFFTSLAGQGWARFGGYAVEGYGEGWFGGTTRVSLLGFGVSSLHQPYHFRFVGAEGARRVECAGTEVSLTVGDSAPQATGSVSVTVPLQPYRLVCEMQLLEAGRGATTLSLEARVPPSWPHSWEGGVTGRLGTGAVELEVRSLTRRESGHDTRDVIGFELLREGRVVGAVQTINAGRVWMLDGQPQEVRDAVALAASVLMLNPRWQSNMFEAAYAQR